MIRFTSLILASLLLVYNIHEVSTFLQSALVPELAGPPSPTEQCPDNLATTCNLQCANGNFVLDTKGCPTCACSTDSPPQRIGKVPMECPLLKCRANCGDAGYESDENGCRTCKCATTSDKDTVPKPRVECSRLMCRMYCVNGFARNENGCEICKCNTSPQACPEVNCDKTCSNGYQKDYSGCQTCQCLCPPATCPSNCTTELKKDENGCPTCTCVSTDDKSKPPVECPRAMCRMYCVHGFARNENGCEICKCNASPQPCPETKCEKTCSNGYRKDYSGCQTCQCLCPSATCPSDCATELKKDENGCSTCTCKDDGDKLIVDDGCSPMKCDLECKYGFQRDASDCSLCACNKCSLYSCRMFCMYGFKKNSDGCEVCECDWTPVSENIQCSERIPCTGNRVCNLNLKLCELVSADKVNWFVYNFDVKTELFGDPKFIDAFKNGLINNIAAKYDLEPSQIFVSSIEHDATASFQVMPYFIEDADDFQKKMDQIDSDLNSHEFRKAMPAIVLAIDKVKHKTSTSRWARYQERNPRFALYLTSVALGLVALAFAGLFLIILRKRVKYPTRSESKSPIYDTSYHQAATDDDHYHAIHAPDGTAYVVVESEDIQAPNDKRALV
jgi:hypothetical protein